VDLLNAAFRVPRPALVFFLLLGIGTAMRFHAPDRQSLWDDETFTLKDIAGPVSSMTSHFGFHEAHPPLYFLQLRIWRRMFGASLGAMRLDSAFWGSLSLIFFFFLVRRYLGRDPALIAMALMTFSPYHLAYSQELRPYAFGIAITIASFWVLEICLNEGMRGGWWLLGLLWTALLYTHYWGSFVVASGIFYGWVQSGRCGLRNRVLWTGIAASAVFLFWMPVLANQMKIQSPASFWMPAASILNPMKSAITFTGMFFHHASLAYRAPGPTAWIVIVGGITLVLAAIGSFFGPRVAVYWLFIGIGLPYVLSYYEHGLFNWYRYPFLLYPAFLLMVTSALVMMPGRWLRWSLIGILVLQGGWGCEYYITRWQKANPKSVMAYVQELKDANTVVVRPFYFATLFNFYDHGPTLVIDQDKLDSDEKRAELKGKNIIFVSFEVPADDVRDALLAQYKVQSARYFPGYAHLAITVYKLR
jgi:mannosyltransferase